MDLKCQSRFLEIWNRYFPGAELPITFCYTNDGTGAEPNKPAPHWRCLIGDLARVRRGNSLLVDVESIGCGGGKRYSGFDSNALRDNFEYFLSCGIPGQMEGERYKKSPEIVRELMKVVPAFQAPGRYLLFKRWDQLTTDDNPQIVIFFATPDVLSGLFTWVSYEEPDNEGVIAPFSAGCGSILQYPFAEMTRERPRAVLGMFDVSARPYVPAGILTLAIPWPKFQRMIDDAGETFLITQSWARVQKRIEKQGAC